MCCLMICVHCLLVLPEQPDGEGISDWRRAVLERLREERDGGGGGGLGFIGMACVKMAQGQWKDACTLIETGTGTCKRKQANGTCA